MEVQDIDKRSSLIQPLFASLVKNVSEDATSFKENGKKKFRKSFSLTAAVLASCAS